MEKIRLKDLNNVTSDAPNVSIIMTEICGYDNSLISKVTRFRKDFIKASDLINEIREFNISLIGLNRSIEINVPKSIDGITYKAMMEIQALTQGENDMQDYIANIISKACFSENYKIDYSSNTGEYKEFKKLILNSSLIDMMGVYNWVVKAIGESNIEWKKRFLSVHVDDPEYNQANAGAMDQFNVIRTIKNLCKDFNVDYYQAWQLSYALTQTSSYDSATEGYVQDKLRKIKEAKFKAQQKQA